MYSVHHPCTLLDFRYISHSSSIVLDSHRRNQKNSSSSRDAALLHYYCCSSRHLPTSLAVPRKASFVHCSFHSLLPTEYSVRITDIFFFPSPIPDLSFSFNEWSPASAPHASPSYNRAEHPLADRSGKSTTPRLGISAMVTCYRGQPKGHQSASV